MCRAVPMRPIPASAPTVYRDFFINSRGDARIAPIKQLPYILAPMEKLCYDDTINIFISGKGERHG